MLVDNGEAATVMAPAPTRRRWPAMAMVIVEATTEREGVVPITAYRWAIDPARVVRFLSGEGGGPGGHRIERRRLCTLTSATRRRYDRSGSQRVVVQRLFSERHRSPAGRTYMAGARLRFEELVTNQRKVIGR
mmetsp:Transcript_14468/g.27582  ORF Transcript_14468/g.27582 Transcript_14468/m.27582 type:complete len:133 (-) Transcript_14468:598-996(-)